MSQPSYVGQSACNVDGLEKVMGHAQYVADLSVPGMLHARMLLSPVPHARIVHLDVAPALLVPGVLAALTCDDFVDHGRYGWPKKDSWVLAHGKVRYVGDPMATVAAESEEAARAGIAAIEVELEELPGVFDASHSLDPDAPLVPSAPLVGEGNLVETLIVRNGDPAPILKECPVVLDETYWCHQQEHAYLETESSLAVPQQDGGVIVYVNTQSPFITQGNLAATLGLPLDKVRIIQPPVGGSFGGKDDIGYQIGSQVAALALKLRRPVRMTLRREQSFLASYKREAMCARIVLGAGADGTLKAARVNMVVDSGAYPSETSLAGWRASMHAAGAYRYQAVSVDADVVYTNNGYAGAFRGFGNTGATAMIEQAMDELAERLGRDPIDLRLRNCLREGDRAMTGNAITHQFGLADCLRWVRERSDWDRKREAFARDHQDLRRGIGVACYFHGSGLGGEGADYATTTLEVEDDCRIALTSGLTDYGQGSRTVFTLIAAEVLSLPPARIHVLRPDTDTAIESGPTVASRCSLVGGNATKVAAEKLDQLLRSAAASALACSPDQIAREGERYVGRDGESLAFEQVVAKARKMGLKLAVQGSWHMPIIEWDFETGTGIPYYCYSFGAQVAQVQVDIRTGEVVVQGVWAAHDGGRIIFPEGAAGQLLGGIAQGLGYALMEQARFQQGYPSRGLNLDGYLVPTARDMPPVEWTFIQNDFPEGPYGARNVAEPVMLATAPAISNAIYQATGRRHRTIPIPLEQVLLGHPLTRSGAIDQAQAAAGFTKGKSWKRYRNVDPAQPL
ncbi:MAG: xanthine dehydrogenase family protein molybdopterin-binding subunit [Chloroflexi bacterium]|nr:xanthine dehydrogenase family protein molybdopterin-binding subunit [Chloroflexota bacterium]